MKVVTLFSDGCLGLGINLQVSSAKRRVEEISTVLCGRDFHCILWKRFPLYSVEEISTVFFH